MWAAIGAGLQLILLIAQWFFKLDDEKKKKVAEKIKELPNVKTTSDITRMFDDISRL